MQRDILFLLKPGFADPALPEQDFYCWSCALIEGVLASFPDLQPDMDIRRIAFPRPRREVLALIGEASQSLPVLILADDAPADLATRMHDGRGYVKEPMAILDLLHRRHGFPRRIRDPGPIAGFAERVRFRRNPGGSRMTATTETSPAPTQSAGWRGQFAGFALALSIFSIFWFALAAVGTKLGFWTWQVGLGQMTIGWGPMLLMAATGVSVLAVIVSLIKSPRKRAFMLAFAALLISGLAFGRVAAFGAAAARLPPLHDIQTDWSDPIQPSDSLMADREATGALNPVENDPVIIDGANGRWPGMGGRRVAEVQEEAEFDTATHESPKETPYPLIAPLITAATPEAAYTAALTTIEERGWTIVLAEPGTGVIEATEESFWFGFKDDVMIRVRSESEGARVDIRSTSRVGLSDLGANAKRIRDLLDEIETRLGKGV